MKTAAEQLLHRLERLQGKHIFSLCCFVRFTFFPFFLWDISFHQLHIGNAYFCVQNEDVKKNNKRCIFAEQILMFVHHVKIIVINEKVKEQI